MSLQESDEAAKAVQKTQNRIPLDYLKDQILAEHLLPRPGHLGHITVLMLELKNGFIVIGKSAPADPENYNAELGVRFAREDAIRQLWPLFAFALRCDMAGQSVGDDIALYWASEAPESVTLAELDDMDTERANAAPAGD
jgi:Phage protein (N4 Gp49/phage Sf6 gene 66) family